MQLRVLVSSLRFRPELGFALPRARRPARLRAAALSAVSCRARARMCRRNKEHVDFRAARSGAAQRAAPAGSEHRAYTEPIRWRAVANARARDPSAVCEWHRRRRARQGCGRGADGAAERGRHRHPARTTQNAASAVCSVELEISCGIARRTRVAPSKARERQPDPKQGGHPHGPPDRRVESRRNADGNQGLGRRPRGRRVRRAEGRGRRLVRLERRRGQRDRRQRRSDARAGRRRHLRDRRPHEQGLRPVLPRLFERDALAGLPLPQRPRPSTSARSMPATGASMRGSRTS